jgi:hypothetical protein
MVSPQNDPNAGTIGSTVTGRGFVPAEETQVARMPSALVLARSHVSWGAVIAGSLLSISILVLSASFAYACGVPAYSGQETTVYGWGAGIWAVVTSIVAFYAGGCLSAYMSASTDYRFHMLHGVLTWSLALPLLLIILSWGAMGMRGVIPGGAQTMVMHSNFPQPTWSASTGAAWGAFFALVGGLIFAAIGGASVSNMRRNISV